jgi:hypothetical protein
MRAVYMLELRVDKGAPRGTEAKFLVPEWRRLWHRVKVDCVIGLPMRAVYPMLELRVSKSPPRGTEDLFLVPDWGIQSTLA